MRNKMSEPHHALRILLDVFLLVRFYCRVSWRLDGTTKCCPYYSIEKSDTQLVEQVSTSIKRWQLQHSSCAYFGYLPTRRLSFNSSMLPSVERNWHNSILPSSQRHITILEFYPLCYVTHERSHTKQRSRKRSLPRVVEIPWRWSS